MSPRLTKHEVSECLQNRTAGIDWYRSILDSTNNMAAARALAADVHEEDLARGGKVRPWKFMGYEGYASKSIRWGVRDWRLLWETSGEAAPTTWGRMAQYGGRATRLDVQTTLTLSKPLTGFGSLCMSSSTPTSRPRTSPTKRRGRSSDSSGLWCGTVGVRTDPAYWRVYDKGVESGKAPAATMWRLELEAKESLAPKLVEEACKTPDVPTWCEERLRSQWKLAGRSWPLPQRGSLLPTVKPDPRGAPEALSLLLWYQTSIAPTIPRALSVFTTAEVLRAIGLDGQAIPRGSDSAS